MIGIADDGGRARLDQAKALASDVRLTILDWLKRPQDHFAHQKYRRPEEAGVCVTLIAAKLGVSQPTASRHLEILWRAGFLDQERFERWAFYKRNESAIGDFKRWFTDAV